MNDVPGLYFPFGIPPGMVTVSGTPVAGQIAFFAGPNSITNANTGNSLLMGDGATGNFAQVTIGAGLLLTGTTLSATGGGGLTVQNIAAAKIGGGLTYVTAASVTIGAGTRVGAGNVVLNQTAALTKLTSAPWAAGNAAGGMGNGLAIAPSTVYHVFFVNITATNIADSFIDTSVTGANLPAGTNAPSRVGSFLTDGASNIRPFDQYGQYVHLRAPLRDLTNVVVGVAAVLETLTVPTGVKVFPLLSITTQDGTGVSSSVAVWSPDVTAAPASQAPYYVAQTGAAINVPGQAMLSNVISNTLAQVYMAGATATLGVSSYTLGWIDPSMASAT